jgi:hypothetical protein
MEKVLIWLVVVAALSALCLAKPNAGRIAMGLFFIAMAIGVNGALLLADPHSYVTFAGGSPIPLYRELALRVVAPSPMLFGLALVAFELTVGVLAWQRGRAVRLGLAGMALFLLGIIPLGAEELPNAVLAAALVYLGTKEFDATLVEAVRARFGARRPAAPAAGGPASGEASIERRVA